MRKQFATYELVISHEDNEIGVLVESNELGKELRYEIQGEDLVVSSPKGEYVYKSLSEAVREFVSNSNEFFLIDVDQEKVFVANK